MEEIVFVVVFFLVRLVFVGVVVIIAVHIDGVFKGVRLAATVQIIIVIRVGAGQSIVKPAQHRRRATKDPLRFILLVVINTK